MAKVICAAIECKYNSDDHTCNAEEINLSEGYYHTVNEGFMQMWKCKNYDKDERYAELEIKFLEMIKEDQKNKKY